MILKLIFWIGTLDLGKDEVFLLKVVNFLENLVWVRLGFRGIWRNGVFCLKGWIRGHLDSKGRVKTRHVMESFLLLLYVWVKKSGLKK